MSAAAAPPAVPATVRVRAPGRLHLGFLDPSGSLGRRFGSIGLVIDGFETVVELAAADSDAVEAVEAGEGGEGGEGGDGADGAEGRVGVGDSTERDPAAAWTPSAALPPAESLQRRHVSPGDAQRAAGHLAALRERTGWQQPLRLRLLGTLPSHAGLGSGTQLALAVGRAFACLHARQQPVADDPPAGRSRLAADRGPAGAAADESTARVSSACLAQWLARGARSGVGIAGFDSGGLLVDGGPAADGTPARLLSRLDFPAGWRIVVVLDPRRRGLSGGGERQAIAGLPPLPQAAAADICHQLLMRVLPGAAAAEFAPFAAGITRIQQLLGDHFAPAQGGSAFSSAAVAGALGWMAANAAQPPGCGQSSWGPTGFAIVESQRDAEALVTAAHSAGAIDSALDVRIVGARNHGATIEWPAATDPA